MKIDNHIHSEYSYDSKIKAQEVIDKAILLQYKAITITEHLDLLPQELGIFGLPSLREYFDSMRRLKEINQNIILLCGIEIGDYHRVRDFASALIAPYPFDLILGSVHFLTDNTNVAIPHPSPLGKAAQTDYYEHNLSLVTDCEIDVLSHLGVYKRYYDQAPDESRCRDVIEAIFRTMIKREIALEVNFSSLRKRYPFVLPEHHYLDLYRNLGGRLFSIGSDSHQIDHFNDHFHRLPKWLIEASILKGNLIYV
ncbi:MAG: histidinol-phosphatase HisJ family protein [Candidatus Cloacimonadaceae bacterium]|nr:histidinol-phosphatase HisJ family protein [Candidatus Cloacimonadaceae bacterium]MDP3114656.1 histidinol-phosphatase HisJ family protein [Candidatus Cloacimonadaceae bacterium]